MPMAIAHRIIAWSNSGPQNPIRGYAICILIATYATVHTDIYI